MPDVTNDEQPPDPTALPTPVTGVARGGRGTGTALDDTQVYDVADLTAAPIGRDAPHVADSPATGSPPEPAPAAPLPVEPVPVVFGVPRANPRPVVRPRPSSERRPRIGAPVAGLVGFALAAGLAILIGASLGGVTVPGGGANGGATPGSTATGVPAATEANDDDDDGKGGKGCKGSGNGRGNCDDD